jgi:hypothetical protein
VRNLSVYITNTVTRLPKGTDAKPYAPLLAAAERASSAR